MLSDVILSNLIVQDTKQDNKLHQHAYLYSLPRLILPRNICLRKLTYSF